MKHNLNLDALRIFDAIKRRRMEILGRGTLPEALLSHCNGKGDYNFELTPAHQRFVGCVEGVVYIQDYVANEDRRMRVLSFQEYIGQGRKTVLSIQEN